MRITISDKKVATQNMVLDLFSDKVERWEAKVQKELASLYVKEFSGDIEWYDSTSDGLKGLISTHSQIAFGISDNGASQLFHPKICVYIGEKPMRHWDKQRPVCVPFDSYKVSRSSHEYAKVIFDRAIPKRTTGYLYAESGRIKSKIKKLMGEKLSIEKEIESAGNQFYAAMLSITTDKKLEELLPSAVKYIPTKEPSNPCKDMVPVELYASVNKLLKGEL